MRRLLLACLFVLIAALPALADPSAYPGEEVEAPPAPKLEGFDWLEGRWVGDHFGEWAEYTVTRGHGDALIGMYRVVNADGATTIMEFDQIVNTPEGVVLNFRLFGPGLEPIANNPFGTEMYTLDEVKPNYAKWKGPPKANVAWQSWTRKGDTLHTHVVFVAPGGEVNEIDLTMELAK